MLTGVNNVLKNDFKTLNVSNEKLELLVASVEEIKDDKKFREMVEFISDLSVEYNFLVIDSFARVISGIAFYVLSGEDNVTVEDIRNKFSRILYKINEHCIINVDKIITRAYAFFIEHIKTINPTYIKYVKEGDKNSLFGYNELYSESEVEKIVNNANTYNKIMELAGPGFCQYFNIMEQVGIKERGEE